MKLQKVMTLGITGVMLLSLAACGNKSVTETHKSTAESSHVTKKHSDKKKSSLKIIKSNSKNISSSNSSNSVATTSDSSSISSSTKKSTALIMSAEDARNLVKEHLSNQRANALQAGKPAPNQPSVDSINGFTTQNNGNVWTVTGNYNGQNYTYHVTPNAVSGN